MNELVSLIITTYKGSKQLSRAINSVIKQTYKNIEIIVVDDNHPDSEERKKTQKILENYNLSNIKYIKHKQNLNGATARNTGLKYSKGKYISFLDDDDVLFPDRIRKCVDKIKDTSYHGVYCSVALTNEDSIMGIVNANRIINIKDLLLNEMSIGTGSNIFLKAEVFKTIKGFDERFKRHQDIEFMIRVLNEYKIININEVLIIKATNGIVNIPNYTDFIANKSLFFNKYRNEINKLEVTEKINFYNYHYDKLFHSALNSKSMDNINQVIELITSYRKLNAKEYIMILMLKIGFYKSKLYNYLIKIIIKYKNSNKNYVKNIDEYTKKFIIDNISNHS